MKIIYESPEQQHSFNFPFQLGSIGDDPRYALDQTHDVQHMDLIILASDGLLDNIPSGSVAEFITKYLELHSLDASSIDHKKLASSLATQAFKLSSRTDYVSPFQKRAALSGMLFSGGKMDDITVVLGSVIIDQ